MHLLSLSDGIKNSGGADGMTGRGSGRVLETLQSQPWCSHAVGSHRIALSDPFHLPK